jgi:hypothetical protein
VVVAGQRELRLQPRFVELLLHAELEGVARQEGRRRHAVQGRAGRQQHHFGLALQDAPQGGQALADQVLVRGELVVGQGFPIGKQRAAQVRREEGDLVHQPLRIVGIGRDDGRQAAFLEFPLGQPGEQQRVGGTHRSWQGHAPAG